MVRNGKYEPARRRVLFISGLLAVGASATWTVAIAAKVFLAIIYLHGIDNDFSIL